MFIKHFREVRYRVPDPTRPGHTVFDVRMDASGTEKIAHAGREYTADDGWFDVPDEVGQFFVSRPGWCTPEMVDEEIVAGRIRADDSDRLPDTRSKVGKKSKRAKASSKDVS